MSRKIKKIITLGPATCTEDMLRKIQGRGVDFVRVNMSHSSIEQLEYFLGLAIKVGIPFIIDTEGSQIRTGNLEQEKIYYHENQRVRLCADDIVGNEEQIYIKPGFVISKLDEGDILHTDFDSLTILVTDVSRVIDGYVTGKVITSGFLGRNKALIINKRSDEPVILPNLSEKDHEAIAVGLRNNVQHVAFSFARSAQAVEEIRRISEGKMRIISKIECLDGLRNLENIIAASDFLLIDRGDLSKEIPITKIPLMQKMIIAKARDAGKGVFVATNLLESMVEKRKPTRAEVHDVVATILDGAFGLTLAAETAIGKHPIECINVLNDLIGHVESAIGFPKVDDTPFAYRESLEKADYVRNFDTTSLIGPHGGRLVNRFRYPVPEAETYSALKSITLSENNLLEAEQIANGVYSPLEGFMTQQDLRSVLDNMTLADGTVWPLPITLNIGRVDAVTMIAGERITLKDAGNNFVGFLDISEIYEMDLTELARKIYGTDDINHPGVNQIKNLKPVFLAGKIEIFRRRNSLTLAHELTPAQMRKLFLEKDWANIAAFHTRNVPHRGHEYLQKQVLQAGNCDGLLIHPVVGPKKAGDFSAQCLIGAYEILIERFFAPDQAVLAAFPTFSRYAGPREAVFTALCRKNYGCSHFVVGRDHAGVGNYYSPSSSQEIFNTMPDIGIQIIPVSEVVYSESSKAFYFSDLFPDDPAQKRTLSGTAAREAFLTNSSPPDWLMRREISDYIRSLATKGEGIFVR